MFDRILVAVDGSDHALGAVKIAAEVQQRFDSELFILCVYRHHSLLEASMSMVRPDDDPEILDDSMAEVAGEVVEKAKALAGELGAGKVRGFIKSGPPARTIVAFAKEKEVNLIVLGSRGLGDVEGYLLGSVSHKVTSLAGCPVMVA
jgi:nucleotide-binding universal stress UspA family protein